jgi:pyruvate formate lyase activating enzyme
LAIRLAGREVSVEALVVEVAKDKVFFDKSGGGVTFSGGEPLDQVEFLVGCVGKLGAEGIGVAIETCLAVAPETLEALLPYPIHWLVDVKHVDAGKYLDQTTGDLDQTLANVRALSLASTRVTYRIPLIPGFNDSDEDRGRILAFLGSLERASADALRVDILPYHELAAGKYLQLGRSSPYDRRPLTSERADQWRQALSDRGFSVDLGGR